MNIWIDLANAPHVAFFLPIIRKLKSRGHNILISVRDFNQTVELMRKSGLDGKSIGKHGGKSLVGKFLNLLGRSMRLTYFGWRGRVDVAVSHNSYTQTIAGRLIGARVITIMDYEGQPANHVAFRLAHRVIVPDAFPLHDLKRFGCSEDRVIRYHGFKEQLYLSNFRPDPRFVDEFIRVCRLKGDWDAEQTVIVTVRAPATMAIYHHFKNLLFDKLLTVLNDHKGLTVILLPRNSIQRIIYKTKYPRIHIPEEPLSGSDLVYFSDLVVSAGGTMNREAAVMGVPVYTIFAGKLPSVDNCLIQMGRMTEIRDLEDIQRIRFEKKNRKRILKNPSLCEEIVNNILEQPNKRVSQSEEKTQNLG